MAVRHEKREMVFQYAPLLTSVKLASGLPSLRQRMALEAIHDCLRAAKERMGMRILEFAVLSNHVHFIVQVDDNEALSRGMQGLLIRIARALNRIWGRKGKVFAERFHSSLLKHSRALWRAIRYVLQNGRKHGIPLPIDRPDPYTSGPWFKSWSGRNREPFDASDPPVSRMVCNVYFLENVYRYFHLELTALPGPSPAVTSPLW